MAVDVCVAEIPLLVIIRAIPQIGLDLVLAHGLLGDIGEEFLLLFVPVDLGHSLIFLPVLHIGAEKRHELPNQLHRDLRQGRGKPGPDLLKFHHIVFGGN